MDLAPNGPSNGHPAHGRRQIVLERNQQQQNECPPASQEPMSKANGQHDAGPPAAAARKLDIGVVTIGYNLPGATRALVESALRDCRHRVSFIVFSHSQMPQKLDELDALANRPDVVYRNYGQNRGLAKSWNEGILWAFENQLDVTLVVNEDVLFAPGDLARLAEAAFCQPDRFLVTGRCFHESENRWESSEYGCFAINRQALDVLGCFDENFFPVYCEDSDYRRRAKLAGLKAGYCRKVSLCHQGSASLRQDDVARQNQITYAGNRAYYARKWGGDAEQETFQTPFNEPRFTFYIAPQDRQAPYPGFNRTDQHLVLV
jgi:GT2 family glycosyltransferase